MSSDQARTCPKCSRQVERGFKFCDACGTSLEAAAGTSATVASPPAPPARGGHPDQESGRFGVAGKIRWKDPEGVAGVGEEPGAAAVAPTPTWRPVTDEPESGSSLSTALRFGVHLVAAWLAGVLAVALVATVTTLATGGRVALLEIRGLPIFIAGAVSIVIFALLQTSGRRASKGWVAGTTVIGFLVLVGAVVGAFQPSVMADMQRRLDRTIGVFGEEDTRATEGFLGAVDAWNSEITRYRSDVLLAYQQGLAAVAVADAEVGNAAEAQEAVEQRFRSDVVSSEEALAGIIGRMLDQAGAASYGPLRDGLGDLAEIYAEQLEGVRAVNQGFIEGDQETIAAGDEQYKQAVQRSVAYVDASLEDIFARGPVNGAEFRDTVASLSR